MLGIIGDLKYAVRILVKTPGFSVLAILTLGLAIGVNATVFTWAQAIVLNPLPGAKDSGRLVTLHEVMTGAGGRLVSVSYPDYRDFRDRNDVFSGVLATEMEPIGIGGNGSPERIFGEEVTPNYFDVLGVRLFKGRTFSPDDENVPRHEAVIAYKMWRERFSSDPAVIGKTILLNNQTFTVIAVAPANFDGSWGGLALQAWVPLSVAKSLTNSIDISANDRGYRSLQVMARLRPGVSVASAQANIQSIARDLGRQYPNVSSGFDARVFPVSREPFSGQGLFMPAIAALSLIAGLVLLIACANIANLWLARGRSRQQELAVRSALGAGRRRLIRQLMIEALLVSMAGGSLGFLFAIWTAGSLASLIPDVGYPISFDLRVNFEVLGFTFVVAVLTVMLSALAPALRASNPRLSGLRASSGAADGTRNRLRSCLVAVQVAFCCVALVAAGLLIRSLQRAGSVDPGFNPDKVLIGSVDLFSQGYDQERGMALYRRLLEGLRAAPGIASVSLVDRLPLRLVGDNSTSVSIQGYTPRKGEQIDIEWHTVGPNYFSTMETPLVAGRDFTGQDDSNHPQVIVINQTMARVYFAGKDPIGKLMDAGFQKGLQIVGVVKDAKERTLNDPPQPVMYFPVFQRYSPQMTAIVRTQAGPWTALTPLQNTLRSLDANLPLFEVETLVHATGVSRLTQSIAAKLLGVFGVLALTLAAIGSYGVLAQSLAGRKQEIGIRMALGANRRQILQLIILRGMFAPAAGLLTGLAAALVAGRLMTDMLIGVRFHDPVTFILVAGVLMTASVFATFLPARRACSENPINALRQE